MTRRDPGLLQLKHGALLVVALIVAVTAAPVYENEQTAIESYDGVENGCYYNYNHYGEGDRIVTNEPCLNCTCHNRMLMCYLRVCPFTKPIGQDCIVEKREDQCCPVITCPEVPVELVDNSSTNITSTELALPDNYGCSINGRFYAEGAQVPSNANKPCELCYCIRNMTACVMQECTLHIDGCQPIYNKGVCCPVRYSCDHESDGLLLDDHSTTTVRPTEGFVLTTPKTETQECVYSNITYFDGTLIKTKDPCKHCYCMKGDIVCAVPECGEPLEHEDCVAVPPRKGQCCPDTYVCNGSETVTIPPEADSQLDEHQQHVVPQKIPVKGGADTKRPIQEKPKDTKVDKSSEEDLGEDEFTTVESHPTRTDSIEKETEKPHSNKDEGEPIENLSSTTDKEDSEEKFTKPPLATSIDDDETIKEHIQKPDVIDDRFSGDETLSQVTTEHSEIHDSTDLTNEDEEAPKHESGPKEQTTEAAEITTVIADQPLTVKLVNVETDDEESSGSEPTLPTLTKVNEDKLSKTEKPESVETIPTTEVYSEEEEMSKGDGIRGSAESGESTEDKIPTIDEKNTEIPQAQEIITEPTPSKPITEHDTSGLINDGEIPSQTTETALNEETTLSTVEQNHETETTIQPDQKSTVPGRITDSVETTQKFSDDMTDVIDEQLTTSMPLEAPKDKKTSEIPTRVADIEKEKIDSESETTTKSSERTTVVPDQQDFTTVLQSDLTVTSRPNDSSEMNENETKTEKAVSSTEPINEGTTTRAIETAHETSADEDATEVPGRTEEATARIPEKDIVNVTNVLSENEENMTEKMTTEIPELTTKKSELDYAVLPQKEIVTELPSLSSEDEKEPEPVTLSQKPMESDSHIVDETTLHPNFETPTDAMTQQEESDEMNTVIPDKTTEQPDKVYILPTTVQPEFTADEDVPARVPGEGDCLFNGITYLNNAPIPTDEECLESCVCFNSIVRCKSTCDLESGTTPIPEEEDTTAVVVEVTKPSIEFPAIVKEIYPTEAPVTEQDNTEENEIDSEKDTTSRPFVKAPLIPGSNEIDTEIQTTEKQRDYDATTVKHDLQVTEQAVQEHVTNLSEEEMEHFTEKLHEQFTEISEDKEQEITEPIVYLSTEKTDELELTTESSNLLEEQSTKKRDEQDDTTSSSKEPESQDSEKPNQIDEDKIMNINELERNTITPESIDDEADRKTEKSPETTDIEGEHVTQEPEMKTNAPLDGTNADKNKTDIEHVAEETSSEPEATSIPEADFDVEPVEETTVRLSGESPGSIDDRLGSGADENNVQEVTTVKTDIKTEQPSNERTIVPVHDEQKTTVETLVYTTLSSMKIDDDEGYSETTQKPKKDIVFDQKLETSSPSVENDNDSSTHATELAQDTTLAPEDIDDEKEVSHPHTTSAPEITELPVTLKTNLKPMNDDDDELLHTTMKPLVENSKPIDEPTEDTEEDKTELDQQKTEKPVYPETTAKSQDEHSTESIQSGEENVVIPVETTIKPEDQKIGGDLVNEKPEVLVDETTPVFEPTEEPSTVTKMLVVTSQSTESNLLVEDAENKKHIGSTEAIDSKFSEETTTSFTEIDETTQAQVSEEHITEPKTVDYTNKPVVEVETTSKPIDVDMTTQPQNELAKPVEPLDRVKPDSEGSVEMTEVSPYQETTTKTLEHEEKEIQTEKPESQTTVIANASDEEKGESQTEKTEKETTELYKTSEDEEKDVHTEKPKDQTIESAMKIDGKKKESETEIQEEQTTVSPTTSVDEEKESLSEKPETQTTVPAKTSDKEEKESLTEKPEAETTELAIEGENEETKAQTEINDSLTTVKAKTSEDEETEASTEKPVSQTTVKSKTSEDEEKESLTEKPEIHTTVPAKTNDDSEKDSLTEKPEVETTELAKTSEDDEEESLTEQPETQTTVPVKTNDDGEKESLTEKPEAETTELAIKSENEETEAQTERNYSETTVKTKTSEDEETEASTEKPVSQTTVKSRTSEDEEKELLTEKPEIHTTVPAKTNDDGEKDSLTEKPEVETTELAKTSEDDEKELLTEQPETQTTVPVKTNDDGEKESLTEKPEAKTTELAKTSEDDEKESPTEQPETHTTVPAKTNDDGEKESLTEKPVAETTDLAKTSKDEEKESLTEKPEPETTELTKTSEDQEKVLQTEKPENQTTESIMNIDGTEKEAQTEKVEAQTTVPVRSQFDSSEDVISSTDDNIKEMDVSKPEVTTTHAFTEETTNKPIEDDSKEEIKPDTPIKETIDMEATTSKPSGVEDETTSKKADETTDEAVEVDVQATKKPTIDDIQKPIHHDHSIPEHPVEETYTTNSPNKSPGVPQAGYPNYDEDYTEEDEDPTQFGPGTCRYGGKLYVSAQQIPRDDPCDFCFCFRSDIICLQQSCPPPIQNCHEEPISGFCCPRYECHVGMATIMNITTSTTTTTTTLPPHFVNSYKGAAKKSGCLIQGKAYSVGEEVHQSSGPCMRCECGGDAQMKCEPRMCSAAPMLQQMIAAAQRKKR